MLQPQVWISSAAGEALQLHTTFERKEAWPLQLSLPK